jgi:hypothetical protein
MAVPRDVKLTVPVGTSGLAGTTIAVNVTEAPEVDGFRLEVTVVVEAAWFTTCESVPLLPAWFVSPEYPAAMVSVPPGRRLVVQVAVREEERVTAEQPAMTTPFEAKPTVPVGVGVPTGATVAVKVTDWSAVEGLALDASVVVVAVPEKGVNTKPCSTLLVSR